MMKTNEDRNVIGVLRGRLEFSEVVWSSQRSFGVLRGRLEFSERNDNVSEGSGGAWSSGVWLA